MIHGKDIIILSDGKAIAASKTCTISRKLETIEVSTPDSEQSREYIAGRETWEVSISTLVSDFVTAIEQIDRSTVTLKMMQGGRGMTGTAICTECKITATKGNLAQGSFKFQGTGPLLPDYETEE